MDISARIAAIFPEENEIPPQFAFDDQVIQREYLINGLLHQWDGAMQEVLSPVCIKKDGTTTRKVIGAYPMLEGEQALLALEAAVNAYDHGRGRWPTMSVAERIRHVEEFTYRMKEERTEVIKLLMWEIGKSYKDAAKEFDRTVDYINDTIDALKDLDRTSSRFLIEEGIIGQVRRAPLGVVLCMGPFNYPLNETFTTLIPALIMGNSIIFKPPKLGVLLHAPLLKAFRDSFPAGVVNTVYGDGATVTGPLMTSGKIDVLAFIGSSRVADILKQQHPHPHRLRSVLGLDAKNPGIILADADLDVAIKETLMGTLSYNGQRCTALKILFVHKDIVQPFLDGYCAALNSLLFGMPWQDKVDLTPLPEHGKSLYLQMLVNEALEKGAKVVNEEMGGGLINETFFFPAVVYPVNDQMRLYREEQFGPVVPIVPFTSINEPIDYIVQSNYGQQVSIFGNDADQIADLIDPLVNQVCRVNINSQCQRGPDKFPFTGRKDSAEGTLSVSDALRVFSIRTIVAAKDSGANKALIKNIVLERHSNFLNTDFIF